MSYKVSVIIPIYGVEKFIGRCAKTLMQQTLKEVEYIFVNDATPDCSMKVLQEVLARYPERQNSVVVAVHETNKGLPAARNTGLQMAQGEYIFHCDSDDFVEPDMLETLYTEAVMHRADIVSNNASDVSAAIISGIPAVAYKYHSSVIVVTVIVLYKGILAIVVGIESLCIPGRFMSPYFVILYDGIVTTPRPDACCCLCHRKNVG